MAALRLVCIKTAPERSAAKDIAIVARPGGQKPSRITLIRRDSLIGRQCAAPFPRGRGGERTGREEETSVHGQVIITYIQTTASRIAESVTTSKYGVNRQL